jgi:hypothetical protein
MVAGKGGGLLDAELVRQLAQTDDTYHAKAGLKDSVVYVLVSMTLMAIVLGILGIILLVF